MPAQRASQLGLTCRYCGTPIRRGKYCCAACGELWRELRRDENRDEKPVELLEPVLRCCEGSRWCVVGMKTKDFQNNA